MADDYLTVDEVAAQLAVPLEMIQRRIESGDIPVHWVEVGGKLEMRISSAEIGVESAPSQPTPFPTPDALGAEEPALESSPSSPQGWSVRQPEYPAEVWGAPPSPAPPPSGESAPPWGVAPEAEPGGEPEAAAESVSPVPEEATVPVWRAEPSTWEDEPLETPAETPERPQYSEASGDSFFPLDEEDEADEASYGAPPPPVPAAREEASPAADDDEEESPFAVEDAAPFGGEEPAAFAAEEETAFSDEDEPFALPATPELEPSEDLLSGLGDRDQSRLQPEEPLDVPRPSTLVSARAEDTIPAINSIDARELVAGLFERWERALEQRIQAEQRLRFEAELERRLRQVRDLRQELENTRKSTAAQLAEREQEVLALRNRLREQDEAPSKGRGLFRR